MLIRTLKRLTATIILCALPFLKVFGAPTSAPARVAFPSKEAITVAAQNVYLEITRFENALKTNRSRASLNELKESLLIYKGLIAIAEQSIDRERGGAATSKAVAAVTTINQFGVDIAFALFALRSENAEDLAKSSLEQPLEDLMVNEVQFPLLKMAFRAMRHRVDERSNVDGKVSGADVLRRTVLEVGRDIFNVFRGGQNRTTGEFYHELLENYYREKLVTSLIPQYARIADSQIPEYNKLYDGDLIYNRENHEERLGGLLLWLTDRAVNIRVERNSAQRYALFFYATAGAILSQPIFNFTGTYAYTAQLETSIMTAAAFAAITSFKFMMSSVKSTAEWVKFNNEIRTEMKEGLIESTEIHLRKEFPTEYYPAQTPKWVLRRIAVRDAIKSYSGKVKASCDMMLTKAKFW